MWVTLHGLFEAALWVIVLVAPLNTAMLVSQHLFPWETKVKARVITGFVWIAAGSAAVYATGNIGSVAFAVFGLLLNMSLGVRYSAYYASGPMFVAVTLMMFLFGTGWAVTFILTEHVSTISQAWMLLGLFLLAFLAPLGFVTLLPLHSYLFRKSWYRPRNPSLPNLRNHYPMISLHVPCFAEPPDVVKSTLDQLSNIEYPNFEVIVVDNNTEDAALWYPVKDHCGKLGNRFRFFHVSPLVGAKAGALNFALRNTHPCAEIIGIIDADYHADPDFIDKLIGFFDDPMIGFVQTPHDYRDWEGNCFQRACYWEYMPAYRLEIACLNEWVASFIIGTMCLIRRCALEGAGGWSEWCLTEDSECSVRIHALGYSSVFLNMTTGRGLIPESFGEYKKQRLRWTIGPIQQLKKHWRLYLPHKWAKPSLLTTSQRLLEFSHSLREISSILSIASIPVGFAAAISLIYHKETIVVPSIIWMAAATYVPSLIAVKWLTYRLAGCDSLADMVGAFIATLSLTHVRIVGSLIGVSGVGPMAWRRTNKFKLFPNKLRALRSVSSEIGIGLLFLALSFMIGKKSSIAPPDVIFLATMGFLSAGLAYLTASIMAFMSEFHLSKQKRVRSCSEKEQSCSVAAYGIPNKESANQLADPARLCRSHLSVTSALDDDQVRDNTGG